MSGLWLVSYVVLWILVLIVSLLLISVLYHVGVIYNRLERRFSQPTKLSAGETLPEVVLQTLGGERVHISQFFGNRIAFVIINPGCSGCLNILKALASGDRIVESPVERTIVVSMRDAPTTLDFVQQVDLPQEHLVLVDTENIIENAWGVGFTPVVMEVDNKLRLSRQTVFASTGAH